VSFKRLTEVESGRIVAGHRCYEVCRAYLRRMIEAPFALFLRLDPAAGFGEIAPTQRTRAMNSSSPRSGGRKIAWQNVMTVLSAAILIGAEVFGAAFAGGWAVANYLDLGHYGVPVMQGIFFLGGIAVMFAFIRNAQRVEPFTTRG
jgi:hypothetical protein